MARATGARNEVSGLDGRDLSIVSLELASPDYLPGTRSVNQAEPLFKPQGKSSEHGLKGQIPTAVKHLRYDFGPVGRADK